MSSGNAEVVRQAILGWNKDGVEALVPALDSDVEFHAPAESMNPGVYRGADGVRRYFGKLAEIVDDSRVESVDTFDVDENRLIADVRLSGKTEHFEERIEVNWAWLITMKDEKAAEVRTFTDRSQALRFSGLAS